MKKIDKILLFSFVGPFVVSFGIALFVLVMQILWLYIDDIAGKGVSILILIELIGYLSVSMFPLALPIAILIASVMVMGNLAEQYELSSMKAAGVSLIRIMRSLIFVGAGITVFSYVCSDFIIPWANLKFKSRLYDIRKQKPALTIEEGIFNEDFRQFVIRVEKKEKDGETIRNVMIEDQTSSSRVKFNQILADSGQMYTTNDNRYFVMNLFDGTQYQEPGTQGGSKGKSEKYPFIRTNFSSMTKIWDLREFEMNRTDEDRFKTQRSALSMSQLRANLDSLSTNISDAKKAIASDLLINVRKKPVKPDEQKRVSPVDSLRQKEAGIQMAKTLAKGKGPNPNMERIRPKLPVQIMDKPLKTYQAFEMTFAAADRPGLIKEAKNRSKSAKTTVETRKAHLNNRTRELVKTGYELYIKYAFALVCFIFLFIGAPMGAIIRKGGFGYPILVSIIFFVTFVMLTIMCRKLAESYILTPFWAAMTPCVVLIPIGAFLTNKAMNDAQMLNTDRLELLTRRFFSRFKKKETVVGA